MITAFLLAALATPPVVATPAPIAIVRQDDDVDAAIRAAGSDVGKLHELAEGYETAKKRSLAKKVHQRIIELAPDDEVSRKALRHQRYDGRWFESYVELAKYKREEEARMKEKGLASWNDQWVPLADLPFLRMRWVRTPEGQWIHPAVLEEQQETAKLQAAGHQFRADDSSWIAPSEFEQWSAMKWKCGDEWLDLEAANEYHDEVEQMWELTGEHFVTHSTCDWNTANSARWHADQIYPHLVRLFGIEPLTKPHFIVLTDLSAYNDTASAQTLLAESEGFSSIHGAYFSDLCFDRSVDPPRYMGTGVCYWDRSDPRTDPWGKFYLRWAAAQSFVEAIDPSWNTIGEWIAIENRGEFAGFTAPFWAEKRIPRWLRYGAAAYVERFLPNYEASEGDDPWSLRQFASSEIQKAGGFRPLEEVFAFELSLEEFENSARLYQESGLAVAYLLDGPKDDEGLKSAHDAFRQSMAGGTPEQTRKAAEALEAALLEREDEIRAFGGLAK